MSNYDWVFWLNLTNIALGIVVVLAVLVVAYGLVWELMLRHKKTSRAKDVDREMQAMLQDGFSHTLNVPELGLTMADGGERVKPDSEKSGEQKRK